VITEPVDSRSFGARSSASRHRAGGLVRKNRAADGRTDRFGKVGEAMVFVSQPLVLVLGVGEIASAVALSLFRSRFREIMTEGDASQELHRFTSFSLVFLEGRCEVEGVSARTAVVTEALGLTERGTLPLLAVHPRSAVDALSPDVVIDAREFDDVTADEFDDPNPLHVGDASLIIAATSRFTIGKDCDMAVLLIRGHYLGQPVINGFDSILAHPDVMQGTGSAVDDDIDKLRVSRSGIFVPAKRVGQKVLAGEPAGHLEGQPVAAGREGFLKGILPGEVPVENNTLVAEIDPRGDEDLIYTLSYACRTISGTVLEMVVAWSIDVGALGVNKEALSLAREVLRQGRWIGIFPQGTRKDSDDLEGGFQGVAFLARVSRVPVIPTRIWNTGQALAATRAPGGDLWGAADLRAIRIRHALTGAIDRGDHDLDRLAAFSLVVEACSEGVE